MSLLHASDYEGDVVWLFELAYAGRIFRWATEKIVVDAATGEALAYDGGLDVDLDDALELFNDSPTARSLPLDLFFPPDVDVALLEAAGHRLSSARGELSMWVDGLTYEEREVVLAGRATGPIHGDIDELVSLSVEENAYDDRSLVIPARARINAITWPQHDPANTGRYYPRPFGQPGVYTKADGTTGKTTGSPVLHVGSAGEPEYAIVALGQVEATTLRVINQTQGLASTLNITEIEDALGTVASVVDVAAGSWMHATGDEYYGRWEGKGGILKSDLSEAIAGAGDLLRLLLNESTLPVDRGRVAAVVPVLNRYVVAGYMDDAVSAWDWIADNLISILQVTITTGPDGLYPVLWEHTATEADAVGHLVEGPSCVRTSRAEASSNETLSSIRLDYAKRADTGDYHRSQVIIGTEPQADDNGRFVGFSTSVTRQAHLRHLDRDGNPQVLERAVKTDVIYDEATATRLLIEMATAESLEWKTVNYSADPHEWGHLREGDVVTITSDGLHLSRRIALVRNATPSANEHALVLVVRENVMRDERALLG